MYAYSLVHYSGFALISSLILFIRFNKNSLYLLATWSLLLLVYSAHYRSQYIVETKDISLFDTYRYLVNALPLFYGILIFGDLKLLIKKFWVRTILIVASLIFLFNSSTMIHYFIEDET